MVSTRPARWTRADLAQHLLDHEVEDARAADGNLPSERTLADRYAVSRPFVREVMRGLAERVGDGCQPERRATYASRPP